jgi:hypothetical protein
MPGKFFVVRVMLARRRSDAAAVSDGHKIVRHDIRCADECSKAALQRNGYGVVGATA